MAHCPGGVITTRPGPAREDGGNFHCRASATPGMTWRLGLLVGGTDSGLGCAADGKTTLSQGVLSVQATPGGGCGRNWPC